MFHPFPMSASHPVFISYARKTSQTQARALHEQLRAASVHAFLDQSNIEIGQRFPRELAEALLAARVVVVFADEHYFRRWYCLRELRMALAPFEEALQRGGDAVRLSCLLQHVLIVLPADSATPAELDRLPAELQHCQAPRANDTAAIVEQVGNRLKLVSCSIRTRLAAHRYTLAQSFLEEASLPTPAHLGGLRLFPQEMPPSIGDRFVGRANDLWRIDFHLRTMGGEPATSAAITGAIAAGGGFGKTRMACEYLHRFGPRYFRGGLFWLNADTDDAGLEQQFHGVLQRLREDTPGLREFRDAKRDARSELASALHEVDSATPVLFVIDNVPEPTLSNPPANLERWCPAIGKVSVLVTSRRKFLGEAYVVSLPIDELDPDAAVTLLTRSVSCSAASPLEWRRIAAWVGHLPIALELLNASLVGYATTTQDLLRLEADAETTEELDRLARVLEPDIPAKALRGATQTFQISYESLSEEARLAACRLSFLSPDPVPGPLLEALGVSPSARSTLLSRHWVTAVEEARAGCFGSMHRVFASFLRSMSTDSDSNLDACGKALLTVLKADSHDEPTLWPLMLQCLPHAEVLWKRMRQASRPGMIAETAVELGIRIGNLRRALGAFELARQVEEEAVTFAIQSLGDEHDLALLAEHNLAHTLCDLGRDDQAIAIEEAVVKVWGQLHGEENLVHRTMMRSLAGMLYAKGDLVRARELIERVRESEPLAPGDESRGTLVMLDHLALIMESQGEHAAALELHERVVSGLRRVLGAEHLDTLTAISNLASTQYAQGDFEGAGKNQEYGLEVCRRRLPQGHPQTRMFMCALARTLLKQGEALRACALLIVASELAGSEQHVPTHKRLDPDFYEAEG